MHSTLSESLYCGLQVVLLNYRKDGTRFWNYLFMSALRDEKGNVRSCSRFIYEILAFLAGLFVAIIFFQCSNQLHISLLVAFLVADSLFRWRPDAHPSHVRQGTSATAGGSVRWPWGCQWRHLAAFANTDCLPGSDPRARTKRWRFATSRHYWRALVRGPEPF